MAVVQNKQLVFFGFGQVIMFLNVISGVISRYLSNDGVSLPTLQSTFLYVTLAVVYLSIKYFVRPTNNTGVPMWFYVILGIVDVEGNYFAVKAFNYANYVTAGLLLNLTVPFATLFCYVFLKTRYSWQHYLGTVIAICGSVTIFIVDYDASINSNSSRELRGDFYCLIAAAFYATSNVMVQWVVKVRDADANIEILGFLGLFASIVSIIQILILEMDPIKDAEFDGHVYGLFVAFVITLFTFYTLVSVFLRWAESLMFNLSLLTGPVFTVFASYILFDEPVKGWYWLALGLFYIGLTLYALAPPPKEVHDVAVVSTPADGFSVIGTPTAKSPATSSKV